jgi:hypothetical protein
MAVGQQSALLRERPGIQRPSAPSMGRSNRSVRDYVLAWVGLALLGTAALAPHVLHGGFYLDDWSNAAGALRPPGGPGFGNALSYFEKLTLYRPVLVLYVPLTYWVLGTHMAYQLAWAAILAIFAAAMLHGVLRTLGVPRLHAWLIAALTLVYPWFDSTRLWVTGSLITLAIGLAFAGLWLAIAGLRRDSWRMHACAAALYLLSIWTYEIALPMIAAAGIVYIAAGGWRRARLRWLVDLLVVTLGGLWIALNTLQESFGLSADLQHLKEIFTSGGTMLGRTLLPFGEQRTALALIVLAAIALIGLGALLMTRGEYTGQGQWGLRGWLTMALGGMAVAALGWVMFIPANPYFTPTIYGLTNRVNALSGFGLVTAVYAALGIVGELVGRTLPRAPRALTRSVVTVLLAITMGAIYTNILERHIRIWNAAYRAEMAGIGEMRKQLPQLAPGTTVFTSDYPVYQTLGVPIFSASWDVNGMVKLQYKDGTLSAYPILPEWHLTCRATGVGLVGAQAPTQTVSYGAAQLLNVHTGEHSQPRSQRECQALAGRYTAGPLYLSFTY